MAHIEIVDQTIRDGQQSLWGLRLQARDAAPIFPNLDRTGFRAIEISGSAHFTVLIRQFRKDPWANLDQLVAGLPNTRTRIGTRANSTIGFALTPYSILDLFIRTTARHGVGSYWIYDCLYEVEEMRRLAQVIHDEGAEVVPSIMYGISDVHTDEYFAQRVREFVSWGITDAIYVEDAPGVLTPERARTLIPALLEAAGDVPIELHSHTTTGLAYQVYIEGLKAGVKIIHTASRPMANGPSIPSTEGMVDILQALGHTHGLDEAQFAPVAERMVEIAEMYGWELGVPNEYSLRPYGHQLPGGMTGTLKNQLAQHGMSDRLDEVLEEIAIVHKELGQPVMATPFSQLLGIQSVLNIVTGDRYSVVPNEVIHFVYGHYGKPPGPIDQDVLDKISDRPVARELRHYERPQPTIDEVRAQYGRHLSDEELVLRCLLPDAEVDAMLNAVAAGGDERASASNIVQTVRELAAEGRAARRLSISRPDLTVRLSRREERVA